MRIEMVSVGEELLDGRVADTNGQRVGSFLASRGHKLSRVSVCGDELGEIVEVLRGASERAELVLVSGGLGPTQDDRTREAVAALLGVCLEEEVSRVEELRGRLEARGVAWTQNNARQGSFPAGAEVLSNGVGTAPGFQVRRGEATLVCMPGVPRELAWFLGEHVEGMIGGEQRVMGQVQCFGLGESRLEAELEGIEELASEVGASVGYRASYPELYVSWSAGDKSGAQRLRDFVVGRVGRWQVGEGEQGLYERLGRLLRERGETVATAESCTAGGIAAALTEIGGSSAWFERGWVTYANEAKEELVGVSRRALEGHGAVSREVVCQMALGARERALASWGVAVSGVAGPGGGSEEKPVGTVYVGIAGEAGVWATRCEFGSRGRGMIRAGTVYMALSLLLWQIEGKLEGRMQGPWEAAEVKGW